MHIKIKYYLKILLPMLLFFILLKPANLMAEQKNRSNFVTEVVEKNLSTVVTISTCESTGAGVIIDASFGLVLTGAHVIREKCPSLVTLDDNPPLLLKTELIKISSELDLALLKIKSPLKLTQANMGSSEHLKKDDPVIAIGNPIGFTNSITTGTIISPNATASQPNNSRVYMNDLIIHTAQTSPGSSGGPIFNKEGDLIGISSMTSKQANRNFAVSSRTIKDFTKEFFTDKTELIEHLNNFYTGLTLNEVNQEIANTHNLPLPWGCLVEKVAPYSPAAKIGLQKNNIIVSINDKPTPNLNACNQILKEMTPNSKIWLEFLQNGKSNMEQLLITETKP